MATSSAHATSSPQREPSMEEILASIRRIIEDNDALRRPGEPGAKMPGDDREPVAATEDEPDFPPAAANSDSRDFTLREAEQENTGLLAAEDHDAGAAPQPEASAVTSEDWPLDLEMAELTELELPQDFASDVLAGEDETAGEPAPSVTSQGAADSEPTASAGNAEPVEPAEPAEPAGTGQVSGIVSASTGRQVAAAFDELSEAFLQSRRRSFDEVAEDMLRPMLQDWLDNNLPTLVERLVREEIERIARGAAR